jgi:hypothetical protein
MKRLWPFLLLLASAICGVWAADTNFDGRPWNISTGNLSVDFIQASPIGAHPRTNGIAGPPSQAEGVGLQKLGLVAYEDYIAWGAVERSAGQWSWEHHDAMEKALHQAGLKYVAYLWLEFPPLWLRQQTDDQRTLMRCMEHSRETFYLSVFDPRTVQWYDRFYKNLHDHFGDRIDAVYACILGPYGEGNYPIAVPDWVDMGHCHQGYWCADRYAREAFQKEMQRRYRKIASLNHAWGTACRSFNEIGPPRYLADEKYTPRPETFSDPTSRRQWLDFITWYHQGIVDFAEQSLRALLKYFPARKVRMKPGGSAGGVNPLAWGTYCPAYAKMAGPYHIVLQPADCQGAVFADKWMGTAYQFYGAKEGTEPAGGLDERTFVRRMFSDADSGASQFFTYEFTAHAGPMQKYIRLYTGRPGETEVAVYCPTTLYRLGGNLGKTITASRALRDLCDFEVLDELLIADGALTTRRYKALLVFQTDIVDRPILDKMDAFKRAGGRILILSDGDIKDVEGRIWLGGTHIDGFSSTNWLAVLARELAGCRGVDGKLDGLWTARRGKEVFIYNSTVKPVQTKTSGQEHSLEAGSILISSP